MKLFQKGLVVVAAVALLVGVAVPAANALTAAEASAIISVLGLSGSQADAINALVTGGASTSTSCSFTTDLTLGSTGAQVTDLQMILVDGGYLTMPAGVSYGYFGSLTQSALAAYQAANGIAPASGYFGPITRASIDCGTTSTGSTGSTGSSSSANADETSLEDYDLKSEDDAEEGQMKHVATIEFDVEDGDATVNRIDITFDNSSVAGTADDEPWDVFETITLMVDGDEVAEEDIDDEDDWLDEDLSSTDNEATFRLSNLDIDFEAGDKAEIEVYLTAANNVDDVANADWIIFIEDEGIRAEDGLLIQNYIGDTTDTVAFSMDEEGGDESIEIKSDSSDPDATAFMVDADDDSDWYEVFIFALEAEENDIDIDTLELTVETGTANYEDVVNDIVIEIDGDEFDDFEVTDPATTTADLVFDIDKDATVDADDRVEVVVMIEFKDQNGNYLVGETVQVTATAVAGEGVDDVSDTATLSSEEHTLELAVAEVTVDDVNVSADDPNDSGTISITFTVDASDADEDIEIAVADNADVTGTDEAAVAQVNEVTVGAVANTTLYTVTLNAVDFDYTSDGDATEQEIVEGLAAAINGGAEPITATEDDVTLTLTADVAGTAFTIAVTANLDETETVANSAFDGADEVEFTITGTDATIAVAGLTLVSDSGDATYGAGTWTVAEGDSATFALDVAFTTVDAADNGTYRVRLDAVAGVTVDEVSSGLTLSN